MSLSHVHERGHAHMLGRRTSCSALKGEREMGPPNSVAPTLHTAPCTRRKKKKEIVGERPMPQSQALEDLSQRDVKAKGVSTTM